MPPVVLALQLKMINIIISSNRKGIPMSKANLIRTWFAGATVYTCIDLRNRIADQFFCRAEWPKLVGITIMIAICWTSRSKLKELK